MKLIEDFHNELKRNESFMGKILFDDDIDRTQIRSTADGGIEVVLYREDEFGNETRYRIILERMDMILLRDLQGKKLIEI